MGLREKLGKLEFFHTHKQIHAFILYSIGSQPLFYEPHAAPRTLCAALSNLSIKRPLFFVTDFFLL